MILDPGRHGRPCKLASLCQAAGLVLLAIRFAGTAASASTIDRPFPGLADPGRPTALSIHAASAEHGSTTPTTRPTSPPKLRGPDARLQLVVTAAYSTGQLRDWTHAVRYAAEPANVVSIS